MSDYLLDDDEELKLWKQYTPKDVIGFTTQYFTEYYNNVEIYCSALLKDEVVRTQTVPSLGDEMTVGDLAQSILSEVERMKRLSRISKKYVQSQEG